MATRGSTGPTSRVGRSATAAAVAGLAGLAITIAIASVMFFNPASAGRVDVHVSYPDYGQRHNAAPNAPGNPRYLDYGIRCVENGWCSTPSSR